MKNTFITLFIFVGCFFTNAQDLSYLDQDSFDFIKNEMYGVNERNQFDIILPKSDKQTPLVIFIHGGGFKKGSKEKLYVREKDITYFINHKIAVATLNYQYRQDNDSLGVKRCINDVQKAIQYIRHHAKTYNLDKSKLACYGSSAGAGMSLYFAFQDDKKNKNDTTVTGESTRLTCAGAIATQATYDVFQWEEFIPYLGFFIMLKKTAFYKMAANFYGYETYEDFEPSKNMICKSLDMISMIDANDPPVYVQNKLEKTFPTNNNVIQHHKNHAIKIGEKLDAVNVSNFVFTHETSNKAKDYPIYQFITEQLQK